MKKRQNNINPGDVLGGRYRIDRKIGAGGMGAVYLATYTEIKRKVAIKLLHPEFSDNAQAVERFHREAQAAGAIGHDNICDVTDIGITEDGAPFLVMPYLKGNSLEKILSSHRLPLTRIVDIFGQTLLALQAAHDVGIVHRDLKPDNIFITRYGDREDFVKLLDFGISKIVDQESNQSLTKTGTILGTPYYMAPEQAQGKKEINHLVDIYAMGVILYEALTGQKPFSGDSYNAIIFKILTQPLTPPSVLNPSVTPALERVVIMAMARDQKKRFQHTSDMRVALQTALDATDIPAYTRLTQAATHTSAASGKVFTPNKSPSADLGAEPASPGTVVYGMPKQAAAISTQTPNQSVNGNSINTVAKIRGRRFRWWMPPVAAMVLGIGVLAGIRFLRERSAELPTVVQPAAQVDTATQTIDVPRKKEADPLTDPPGDTKEVDVSVPHKQLPTLIDAGMSETALKKKVEPPIENRERNRPKQKRRNRKRIAESEVPNTTEETKVIEVKESPNTNRAKGRFRTEFYNDFEKDTADQSD